MLVVMQRDFADSGGYSQRLEGYGSNAAYMRAALFFQGLEPRLLPGGFAERIGHDDFERTKHYCTKDPEESRSHNDRYLQQQVAQWEHATGRSCPTWVFNPKARAKQA